MCFRAVKYLPPRQSYWLYLIHPLSCLPPIYIDYSSMSWLRSKMAAALPQWRCYSLIAIWDFPLCGALGLLCLWQMLSYVHELSYKPMMCFSPSSGVVVSIERVKSALFTKILPNCEALFGHYRHERVKKVFNWVNPHKQKAENIGLIQHAPIIATGACSLLWSSMNQWWTV